MFKLVTNEETHYSKTVIITAGNGAFKPRKLELENAEQYEGKNLHYFVDDLQIDTSFAIGSSISAQSTAESPPPRIATRLPANFCRSSTK